VGLFGCTTRFLVQHELREELRALGTMSGGEVEKTIGDRWKGTYDRSLRHRVHKLSESTKHAGAGCNGRSPMKTSGRLLVQKRSTLAAERPLLKQTSASAAQR
jgi:hypothetical protein